MDPQVFGVLCFKVFFRLLVESTFFIVLFFAKFWKVKILKKFWHLPFCWLIAHGTSTPDCYVLYNQARIHSNFMEIAPDDKDIG